MFLTKIELVGFKSFADRTTFDFDEGITAILGPNGCGKSNVVDAVKWVLGETSAKNLRGTAMADVIFAGSERRKPLGMAEVHLFFDNSDGRLATEYNEVCISRRLFRTGESEYLINKQPCRKRDIRDMLVDTGVGTNAYSIIEQGKVEALLHAKPHERRAVFEEAAGITKYKIRRKETLSRLERTNQCLLRVNDIVEEVEKRIRRVSRQASNARRVQKLRDELRLLKTFSCARKFRKLQEDLESIAKERTEIDQLFARESGSQATLGQALAELTAKETVLRGELETFEQTMLTLQEELGRLQAELSGSRERIQSLQRQRSDSIERAEQLRARLSGIEEAQASALEERETAQLRADELDQKASVLTQARDALQSAFQTIDRQIEQVRLDVRKLEQAQGNLQAEAARIESEEESLSRQTGTLGERGAALSQQQEAVGHDLTALQSSLSDARLSVETVEKDLARHRAAALAHKQTAEIAGQTTSNLIAEQRGKESRLSTLEDLDKSLAGAFQGVKAVLQAQEKNDVACPGVAGMIADLMTVPQDVALAIETTLGGGAQDVVVETARDAQRCIEFLKQSRQGRATFLPLDRIRARSRVDARLASLPGVLGDAAALVEFDSRYSAAIEYALAGTLIVETLDRARELSGTEAKGLRIVTLDGEVINPRGAMTGGQGNKQRAGLITRKAEMDALRTDLEALAVSVAEHSRARDAALHALSETEARIAETEEKLRLERRTVQEFERDFLVKTHEANRLAETAKDLDAEAARAGEQKEALILRRESLSANRTSLTAELQSAENALQRHINESREVTENLQSAQGDLTVLLEERAVARSRLEELTRRQDQLANDLAERQQEIGESEAFATRAVDEIAQLTERIGELETQERESLTKRDSSRERVSGMRQSLHALRDEMEEKRSEERAVQKRLDQIRDALNDLKLKANEVALKREAVVQQAHDELEITDLVAKSAEIAEMEVQAELAFREVAENADSEEAAEAVRSIKLPYLDGMDRPLPAMTLEQIEIQISDTTVKIDRIGPVNMCAIEELTELEARAAFLTSEQDDLQRAADDLLAVIDRLNTECSTRFEETFHTVRKNFQDLFRRLFGGGRADLVLEKPEGEGADILDAGIDIIARPPGKEPKNISLLSGGEKALCAVALLFAIFRSKPSPFCILDEVDGPLDESNIDRFMNAVRDFSSETQFILISHAKRTMGMTDTIYGVTQKEPGISTKYSLQFKEMYDHVVDEENRSALDGQPLPQATRNEGEAGAAMEEPDDLAVVAAG